MDMSSVDQFDNDMFKEFTSMILSFLIRPNQTGRMMQSIEAFAEENGINQTALQSLIRSWLGFFRSAHKANKSPKVFREEILNLGMGEDKATYIAKLYKKNFVALSRALVGRTLNVNQLTDMQWRFGVTSGSSEEHKSGRTFLQLKMALNDGANTQEVLTELTLPQFFSLMKELQQAKASLDTLS
eukprot:m.71078 g.71078  ORF g.71078 m.71078 type:complete len:185 (-) comp12206_c0_seq1:51-605(-)